MNANIKSLAEELKKSVFLRMKVPQDQIDAFVERIISLPEDKKRYGKKSRTSFRRSRTNRSKKFTNFPRKHG